MVVYFSLANFIFLAQHFSGGFDLFFGFLVYPKMQGMTHSSFLLERVSLPSAGGARDGPRFNPTRWNGMDDYVCYPKTHTTHEMGGCGGRLVCFRRLPLRNPLGKLGSDSIINCDSFRTLTLPHRHPFPSSRLVKNICFHGRKIRHTLSIPFRTNTHTSTVIRC